MLESRKREIEIRIRDRIKKTSGQASFILIMISIGLLLSIFAGQSGTLLFYIVVLITLWSRRWDWGYFGMNKPVSWLSTVSKAFLFSVLMYILADFLVQPLMESYLEQVDLSEVSLIEGNLPNYILFIMLGWTLGGFCEEIIFRGYIVKRLAVIFGDTKRSWLLSAIIASIAFGFVHTYQGTAGMITTAIIGFVLALIFIYHRENLMLPILSHGIYNMIAITLIYLGKSRVITDRVLQLIN